MAEFKGTKGTWWVSGTEIISDFYTKIAKIHPTNMNDYSEHKHNAQVMAKAPEMLEMLQNIVSKIYETDISADDIDASEIEKLIKEATEL